MLCLWISFSKYIRYWLHGLYLLIIVVTMMLLFLCFWHIYYYDKFIKHKSVGFKPVPGPISFIVQGPDNDEGASVEYLKKNDWAFSQRMMNLEIQIGLNFRKAVSTFSGIIFSFISESETKNYSNAIANGIGR